MKLYSSRCEDVWTNHQCSFGITAQSVIMLSYSEDIPVLRRGLEESLISLGVNLKVEDCIHISYLDVSIQGLWDAGSFGGKIPCRTIWDASGRRLGAVLIVDSS